MEKIAINAFITYVLKILKTELHTNSGLKNLSSVKYEPSCISGMTNLKTTSL